LGKRVAGDPCAVGAASDTFTDTGKRLPTWRLTARADSENAVGSVQQAWQQALFVAITVGNPLPGGQPGLGGRSGGDANIEEFTERRWPTVNPGPAHYPY
jgi:hypothetical protein